MDPRRRRSLALRAAAALAAVGCAAGGPPPAAPEASFEGGARAVVLVRWTAGRGEGRPRDPLDALEESLAERRIAVRAVEVGPGAKASSPELERLHGWAEAQAFAPPGTGPARVAPLGREAGRIVRDLGVDAVVLFHGFETSPLPPPADPFHRDPFLRSAPPGRGPPLGALTVVDRDGDAVALAWGRPGAELDPGALVNAAEAVTAAMRVLAGEILEE